MDKKEQQVFYKKFEKICIEIWNVKCLARILEELLQDSGNLSGAEISTLSVILTRTVTALSKQSNKLEVELGNKLLL